MQKIKADEVFNNQIKQINQENVNYLIEKIQKELKTATQFPICIWGYSCLLQEAKLALTKSIDNPNLFSITRDKKNYPCFTIDLSPSGWEYYNELLNPKHKTQ